ncbi:MAG: alpha-glucosidase, partial [Candidatus Puniceispirillaceae bacterium]
GGFSDAEDIWLPQGEGHFARAALEQAATAESVYHQFSAFLHWRKSQPAMMQANYMTALSGTDGQIIFDRVSDTQRLRCCFDFDHLDASFEEA